MKGILLLVVSLGGMAVAQAPLAEVGRLYATGGRVDVVRSGAPVTARAAEPVRMGEELRVGPGGRATLFYFEGGRRWSLSPGSRVRLERGGPRRLAGPAPTPLPAFSASGQVIAASSVGASRRTLAPRMRAGDPELAPAGAIRPGPVVLTWRTVGQPDRVDVRTEDDQGTVRWRLRLPGDATTVTLPESATPEGQWVRVILGQVRQDEVLALGRTTIRRMTAAEGATLRNAEAEVARLGAGDRLTLALLQADLYEAAELVNDAIAALDRALALRPKDPGLLARRKVLLRSLGN